MATPAKGYFNAAGQRVPSVTTVIGGNLGWNKTQLMIWANREGLAGRDHRQSSQEAADAGTLAHGMVEAHIHGREYVPTLPASVETFEKARQAYEAYLEWEHDTRLTFIATEFQLVSERHQYGATPDAAALRGNKGVCIPDWKSSKGTYADHVLQLAAYGAAFEEVTGLELTAGYYLARFDKQTGGFSVKWWPREALRGAFRAFVALRQLHELKAECEALTK